MKRKLTQEKRKVIIGDFIGGTRFIMSLAVFSIFLGSAVLLFVGTVDILKGIWYEIFQVSHPTQHEFKIVLIESIDSILISTVLFVIAAGLYQLFINKTLSIPEWMQTKDVSELERRLSGMVVTILGVIFLTKAISDNNFQELLMLGLAISSIIIAISFFLFQEKKA